MRKASRNTKSTDQLKTSKISIQGGPSLKNLAQAKESPLQILTAQSFYQNSRIPLKDTRSAKKPTQPKRDNIQSVKVLKPLKSNNFIEGYSNEMVQKARDTKDGSGPLRSTNAT